MNLNTHLCKPPTFRIRPKRRAPQHPRAGRVSECRNRKSQCVHSTPWSQMEDKQYGVPVS